MYWKIQSNTTYIDSVMIRLHVSAMKLSSSGLFHNYLKNNYRLFVLTWDPSVTDGMSTLGCCNRYYNFFYLYFFGTLEKVRPVVIEYCYGCCMCLMLNYEKGLTMTLS
jgi:hypothetical protein